MAKRSETTYEIKTVSKALQVLMALQSEEFVPLHITEIMEKTGFPRSFCNEALITFKLNGFADQPTKTTWIAGRKLLSFSARYNETVMNVLSKK
ncbi:MAG: hypothetical protein K1X72_04420 [Pyrinomonadaceae bacterium]|nr:hypothetical protein [Pyrinomonadaceae bacterium]